MFYSLLLTFTLQAYWWLCFDSFFSTISMTVCIDKIEHNKIVIKLYTRTLQISRKFLIANRKDVFINFQLNDYDFFILYITKFIILHIIFNSGNRIKLD